MTGIVSYGAYIPMHRLSGEVIGKVWGGRGRGEKAVASYDEDSLTMAVEAGRDCLKGIDPKTVDLLYFASTTSPYLEKQVAATIAVALDLRRDAFTVDFSNSLRGGTSAMQAALDAVNAGSAKRALVCVADMRLGYPMSEQERSFADGAAAILIGDTDVAATVEGSYSLSNEIIDMWRAGQDRFTHSWEDRFVREEGYQRVVTEAVSAALDKYNLTVKDFTKFVCYAPDAGQLNAVARRLGFDVKTQMQDPMSDKIGNTGAAQALMSTVAALEEAKPGERILLASYGDGCDVFILKITEEIEKARKGKRGVKGYLESKLMLNSYERYLRWRGLIDTQPPARPRFERPSAVALWRDNEGGLALYGVKCKKCGTPQYPPQRVCINCGAKDEFEPYRFADKVGEIFTFSHDNLAASVDPPITQCAIDFPEGGRIMCDITDRIPDEVKVGMEVEMTFRKIREVDGICDYWWKCRPIRGK